MIRKFVQRALLAGLVMLGHARAAEVKPFPLAGGTVLLERADSSVGVLFRAFRPNRATGRWDVDVVVTNGSAKPLRLPLVLRFESATGVEPGIAGATADADGKFFLDVSAQAGRVELAPGASLPGFTLALGNGQIRPQVQTALYSSPATLPSTLALVRTLTPEGLPLAGVAAVELGPEAPQTITSARGGWLSLVARAGVRGWRFEFPGHEPVVRLASGLRLGAVNELPSVRPVAASSDPTVRFAPAALPVPVPPGWSPAAVVRGGAGAQSLALSPALPTGQLALLAQWDEGELAWRAVRQFTADGQPTVAVELPAPGLFAVLAADTLPRECRSPAS
jgi:hypothetical protein